MTNEWKCGIISGLDNEPQLMEKSRSWPSAHDWKSCIPQKGIEGSNPSFSAIKKNPGILRNAGISFAYTGRLSLFTINERFDLSVRIPLSLIVFYYIFFAPYPGNETLRPRTEGSSVPGAKIMVKIYFVFRLVPSTSEISEMVIKALGSISVTRVLTLGIWNRFTTK